MSWMDVLKGDSISWLVEHENPGVRYLALRDLLDCPDGDPRLESARAEAHARGPIARVLDAMQPEGFWEKPGPGYGPKYRSTVWAMILLGQLGASVHSDERVARACAYVLDQALGPNGQFSYNKAPGGTFDCLHGNLEWSLVALGCGDPRLEQAYEWAARAITGEGIAPNTDRKAPVRYYAYKCGPLFACGANEGQNCAWGGVKLMLAFSAWPEDRRTPLMRRAIHEGAEFLLDGNPAKAGYPNGLNDHPSSDWWKFGFPVFYVTDLLQNVEALVKLGYARDPRLQDALALIASKQDAAGRWKLEYHYNNKTWINSGPGGQPNPWVTLRALRVLKSAY